MRTLFSVSFFDFPFPSADFIRLPVAAPVSVPRLFFARFRSCGVFDQVFPLVPLFYRTFLTKRISVLRGFLLLVLARAAFLIRRSCSCYCFIALSPRNRFPSCAARLWSPDVPTSAPPTRLCFPPHFFPLFLSSVHIAISAKCVRTAQIFRPVFLGADFLSYPVKIFYLYVKIMCNMIDNRMQMLYNIRVL